MSITGSDGSGGAGIQADVKTIADMGGYPVTALTAITVQNSKSLADIQYLPTDWVVKQVRAIIDDLHPTVAKIGLVGSGPTVERLRHEVIGCRHIVLDPGLISSSGKRMADDATLAAFVDILLPESSLLMLKCNEAELILHTTILSDDDMLGAARRFCEMGAKWVLLRGGSHIEGQLTALLYSENYSRFFTSYNTEGWRKHGVGGALSAAIATRLGMGDDMLSAIRKAHEYIHSQVVYSVAAETKSFRPSDLYNEFLSHLAANYQTAHDVKFYADKLCITSRYLSLITDKVVSKSPKQVIDDYVMNQAKVLLESSRMTIQEVAGKLGFSSQAMFCRYFKHYEGRTPTEFRGQF